MNKLLPALLIALLSVPVAASAGPNNSRRLDAIATGRLYDPILTPQLNPDFELVDPSAEAALLRDIRDGRFNLDRLPPAQRSYYLQLLEAGR
jgi:hypothetical protein